MDEEKNGGVYKKILKKLRYKKNIIETEIFFFEKSNFFKFFKTNYIFYVKFAFRMFLAFI